MRVLRHDLAIALGLAAGALVLQLPFRLCSANLMDEGAILQVADELLHGRRLYADVFHPAFPAVHYLTAAVFFVAGPSIGSARMLAAVLFALTVGAVFLIARWSHGRSGALAVVVLFLAYRVWAYPHWHMVSYSSLAVAVLLVTACVVGEAFGRTASWPYALGGLLAAGAVLAKQDAGTAGAAAVGLAILACAPGGGVLRRRAFAAYAGAATAVLALATAAVLRAGIGRDLVQQTIVAPLFALRHFPYPRRPVLWPLFSQDATLRSQPFSYFPPILVDLHWPAVVQSRLYRDTAVIDVLLKLVYYLPWLVFLAALGARVASRDGADDPRRAREDLVLLIAAAFLAAFNRPQDWIHLLVLYPPTLLLGARLVASLLARAGHWRRPLAAGATLALGIAAGVSALLAVEFGRHHASRVDSAHGPLYAAPSQARALREALAGLAAAPPGAPLASLPYYPLLNFLAARPVATRYYALWPIDPNPRRDDEIVGDLERQPDAAVVYSPTRIPHFPPLSDYAPVLFRYLVDHFAIERTAGGDPDGFTFLLLRRAPAVRPGRSLLGPALAATEVRVEPRDGPARMVAGPERAGLLGEALWPFQPVLRMTVLPGATVGVRYRLRPLPGDRIELNYGLNPDRWLELPPTAVRFVASLAADGTEHEVLASELEPWNRPDDRGWKPARIDLSPWAGRAVELVLQVSGPTWGTTQADRAGWGDPRLVPPETASGAREP